MAETVTLTLPEGVAERAKEAALHTGRSLEDVLTVWLEWGALQADAGLLTPNTQYDLFTPYGNGAAAQILLDMLKTEGVEYKPDQES